MLAPQSFFQRAELHKTLAKNAEELAKINSNVEHNVAVAVSTLQFQDMSSQLLAHAQMRLDALREVARLLESGHADTPAAYRMQLPNCVTSLQEKVSTLNQKTNPVAQQNFDNGNIELF